MDVVLPWTKSGTPLVVRPSQVGQNGLAERHKAAAAELVTLKNREARNPPPGLRPPQRAPRPYAPPRLVAA